MKYGITRGNEIHTKIVDVPTPVKSRFLIDDELEPSRYILLEFEGIHDSYYIGINTIEFYDAKGNTIPFTNIAVDGQDVDYETVQPAFPTGSWWAVVGESHSLVFDFGEVKCPKYVFIWCANAASTPKLLSITDAVETTPYSIRNDADKEGGFEETLHIQLAGKPKKSMEKLLFFMKKNQEGNTNLVSCTKIVEYLNSDPPANGFQGFLTKCGCHFVFYREGLRTSVCNYFFGKDHSTSVQLLNGTLVGSGETIDDVAKRAMTLEELRAVRALIVSNCVEMCWKSGWDGSLLRPEDVNLYDLNSILIKPLTKKRNCAFKELFASGESRPTYYVSHWWGEKVLDFIRCCEYHATAHNLNPSEATYWVCAYANRQHDLGADLGTDPSKSSFNAAMKMSNGVFLVIDPNVVVTTRIWVDYELYRTITTGSMLDIGVFNKGKVHLIADKDLPHETPYQKNRREAKFPFEEVCEKFLKVELYRGEASQQIDRVRILNVMSNNVNNLDDWEIINRIEANDSFDSKFVEDMTHFMKSDTALRSEIATKVVSVALANEQSLRNFYGHDLLDIISSDKTRTTLILDDLVSLDGVNDEIFATLIELVGPNITKLDLNVCGCKNLTNSCVMNLKLPETLVDLSLNIGYAKNITNDSLIHLASLIPQNLESLELDVSGFKTPDGTYLPERYNNHLEEFASKMPKLLKSYKLVTTLTASDDVSGLRTLISSLPRDLKEFTIVFESWEGFRSDYVSTIVSELPVSLQKLSMTQYGGYYIGDTDLISFADDIKANLTDLTEFYLHTRSNAEEVGHYQIRTIESVQELMSFTSDDIMTDEVNE